MRLSFDFKKIYKSSDKSILLEKIFISITIFFLLASFFIKIPSDLTNIGISSSILNIGDREFYINETAKGFGYDGVGDQYNFSGNILYPSILKLITSFTNLFNQDEFSKLWNFINISITSSLSIITFHLLRVSSFNIFNKNISSIACLIYFLNPYTYYFSLSGGLPNYVIFGVSTIFWIFSLCIKKGYKISSTINVKEILGISLSCIFLSSLRPSGGLFALVVLFILCFLNIKYLVSKKRLKSNIFLYCIIYISSIIIVTYNLKDSLSYSLTGINVFANEGGFYFGYSRDLLRERLNSEGLNYFQKFKNFTYLIIWKLTDFVSGLSDIRDTHDAQQIESLFPFIIRTFTGVFILFPINLFSFLGLIFNLKYMIKTDLWIIVLASILTISPSLIGVASSRYLIMVYIPFIVFSAKMINDTFLNITMKKY